MVIDVPKGSKVHKCVDKLKAQGKGKSAYAIYQASTGQSYATGKPLKKTKNESVQTLTFEQRLDQALFGSPRR